MDLRLQAIYIDVRSKVIKHFNDTRNAGRFNDGGFCIDYARRIAKNQLERDLRSGKLLITLDELLLNTDEECARICANRSRMKLQKLLS